MGEGKAAPLEQLKDFKIYTGEHKRLHRCPVCDGKMALAMFTGIDAFTGKNKVAWACYCTKGKADCEYLEITRCYDPDTAVGFANMEIRMRKEELAGKPVILTPRQAGGLLI